MDNDMVQFIVYIMQRHQFDVENYSKGLYSPLLDDTLKTIWDLNDKLENTDLVLFGYLLVMFSNEISADIKDD